MICLMDGEVQRDIGSSRYNRNDNKGAIVVCTIGGRPGWFVKHTTITAGLFVQFGNSFPPSYYVVVATSSCDAWNRGVFACGSYSLVFDDYMFTIQVGIWNHFKFKLQTTITAKR